MELSFVGRRALVTGAGRGIGRAVAKALHGGGASIFAISAIRSELDSLKAECPDIDVACLDISDWTATQKTLGSLGPIDLLVNNAAVCRPTRVLDTSEEDFDAIFSTNVKGTMNVTQVVARGMVERKSGGAIVNISSTGSSRGGIGTYIYGASKAAIDQLTRCMAVELGPHNIRVNAVNPTRVPETVMGQLALSSDANAGDGLLARIPLGRFPQVKDVVHAVLYLLSDKADMINGAFIPIEGGSLCT